MQIKTQRFNFWILQFRRICSLGKVQGSRSSSMLLLTGPTVSVIDILPKKVVEKIIQFLLTELLNFFNHSFCKKCSKETPRPIRKRFRRGVQAPVTFLRKKIHQNCNIWKLKGCILISTEVPLYYMRVIQMVQIKIDM